MDSEAPPASALYWLPRVGAFPTPRTEVVLYDHPATMATWEEAPMDEGNPFAVLVQGVERAAERIGYPVFLRTDLASAKHDGPAAYRAAHPEDVSMALTRTLEDNEIKFWLTGPMPRAVLVREWLNLDAAFSAFGGMGSPGHPIAREWRFFATPEGTQCSHFYWPPEAIEAAPPPEQDWREKLQALGQPLPGYVEHRLGLWAQKAARACDALDYWSVDFARDRAGGWWLIDMAPGEESWHPEHEQET